MFAGHCVDLDYGRFREFVNLFTIPWEKSRAIQLNPHNGGVAVDCSAD
jgi:hypothetical protein